MLENRSPSKPNYLYNYCGSKYTVVTLVFRDLFKFNQYAHCSVLVIYRGFSYVWAQLMGYVVLACGFELGCKGCFVYIIELGNSTENCK